MSISLLVPFLNEYNYYLVSKASMEDKANEIEVGIGSKIADWIRMAGSVILSWFVKKADYRRNRFRLLQQK